MPTGKGRWRHVTPLNAVILAWSWIVLGASALAASSDLSGVGAVTIAVAGAVILALVWRALAPSEPWLLAVVTFAYGLRVLIIGAFTLWANASSRLPFIFGDEAGYHDFARTSWIALRSGADPVHVLLGHWISGANPYVDVQAVGFLMFGVDAGLMRVLNAVFAGLLGLVAWDLAVRLFSRRAGWIAVAYVTFLPSLFLWSVTNLRDTWIALALLVGVWWLERMRTRPHLGWLALGIWDLALIQGLRMLLFMLVSPVFALSLLTGLRHLAPHLRVGATAIALILGPGLMLYRSEAGWFGVDLLEPATLTLIQNSRANMAAGARSGFGEPETRESALVLPPDKIVRVEVATPSARPAAPTPAASAPARPIESASAPPAAATVLASPTPAASAPARPIESATRSPIATPTTSPTPVPVTEASTSTTPPAADLGVRDVVVNAEEAHASFPARAWRILSQIPLGLLYVALAPFPGLTSLGIELPALVEIVPWVAALAAAVATLVMQRSRWLDLMPLASHAIVVTLMLAIVEGNVGTLVRHRSMAIPLVVVLAAPTLAMWTDAATRWLRSRRHLIQ